MLEILYQDKECIAVHKPSGLLVHRTNLVPGEKAAALQILRNQIRQRVFPVHRLDRSASGVLLFALSSEIAAELGASFSNQSIQKTYLALVRGVPPDRVVVDKALPEELDPISDDRAAAVKPAQTAVTALERLESVEIPFAVDRYPTSRYSLVRAMPQTGRKHQIRRHLKHLRHPIIGDANYGVGRHNRFFAEHFKIRRLLLHCFELRFAHPSRGKLLSIQAPLDPEFSNLLAQIGMHLDLSGV